MLLLSRIHRRRAARSPLGAWTRLSLVSLGLFLGCPWALAQNNEAAAPSPATAPRPATIVLKDTTRVVGEVVSLAGGKLVVKTALVGKVTINWSDIEILITYRPHRVVLKDNTELNATLRIISGDLLEIRPVDLQPIRRIPFSDLRAINPSEKKPDTLKYSGNVSIGGSLHEGNTNSRSLNANGELVVTAPDHRVTLKARGNVSESEGTTTERNARFGLKYDYFLTERLYLNSHIQFETNEFQDLSARYTQGAGFGYDFIKENDFEAEALKGLSLSAEGGAAYIIEDLSGGASDDEYPTARWSLKLNWKILPDRITLFHTHEGLPSLANRDDILVKTEQGVRFTIWRQLIATAQVNWDWDNTPSPGAVRRDTAYLLTLGYAFEF